MRNSHRARALYRSDKEVWKLHHLFRNPKTQVVYLKCEVCKAHSRRAPLTKKQIDQLYPTYECLYERT